MSRPQPQVKAPATAPVRFRERPSGPALDDRIGDLLRQVPEAGPLPQQALGRVAARLERRRPRPRGLLALRWAVVAGLVLGTGGVVFARKEIARLIARVGGHAEAPAAVQGLTGTRVAALSSTQFGGLTSAHIAAFTTMAVAGLTTAEIAAMTRNANTR